MINTAEIKKDFPIFDNNDVVYLDNGATTQKPREVIKAITDYYERYNANVHRGIYTLSEKASDAYEQARKKTAKFIGATKPEEVIFTFNSTDSLNLVAFGWGLKNLKQNDQVLICNVEHHSNLVPWQQVTERTGAELVVLDCIDGMSEEHLAHIRDKMTDRVKVVSIFHASNVTGQILNIKEVSKLAHEKGAIVVVDGSQAVPHMKVNVQSLGCDFYAFSGHKMLGPTGVGVLWGREAVLKETDPYRFGGGMISTVEEHSSEWAMIPEKFEAGTPNIAGVIGFGAAIDYLNKIGMDNIREHEIGLNRHALKQLQTVEGMEIIGTPDPELRTGLVSFVIKGTHAHDLAAILSAEGIAVRSGHHCAMPLHTSLKIPASARASYYLYNSNEDIDKLVTALHKAVKILTK